MKKVINKPAMLISAPAAARLFIKIASLRVDPQTKCNLLAKVSDIIGGRLDMDTVIFSSVEEKEIADELAKAIRRSAGARAAAARRRETTASAKVTAKEEAEVVTTVISDEERSDSSGLKKPEDIPAGVVEEAVAPTTNSKKRRRNRRRRRSRGKTV